MLGQKMKLHFTTSGHYSVHLGSATSEEEKVEETFLIIEELDRESKRKACRSCISSLDMLDLVGY